MTLVQDLRGRREIRIWIVSTVLACAMILGFLVEHLPPPHELVAAAAVLLTVMVVRGTEKAGQREASVELNNVETDKLRHATEMMIEERNAHVEERKQLASMITTMLQHQAQLYFPPPLQPPPKEK